MKERPAETTEITRLCVHCFHEWKQAVTRAELEKVLNQQSIGPCPKCELPA